MIWGRVVEYGSCSTNSVMSHVACRINKTIMNLSPSVGNN